MIKMTRKENGRPVVHLVAPKKAALYLKRGWELADKPKKPRKKGN